MVDKLLHIHTRDSNHELIDSLFLPFEAAEINAITLSLRVPKDELVWHYSNKNMCTVRNAYHLALELLH